MGTTEREHYLKLLMEIAVESRRRAEECYEEELSTAEDEEVELEILGLNVLEYVRQNKKALYSVLCEAICRNAEYVNGTPLKGKERNIIRWRYIKGKSWGMVNVKTGYSRAHCYNLLNSALRKIAANHPNVDFQSLYYEEKKKLDDVETNDCILCS